ncbi:Endonuclease/exonuclease/phosphatase superfamily [Sesbania bispinosa]|nr:Endonuclease/exonuclease/phosphatase superfamily [Sesbania bispinosa]
MEIHNQTREKDPPKQFETVSKDVSPSLIQEKDKKDEWEKEILAMMSRYHNKRWEARANGEFVGDLFSMDKSSFFNIMQGMPSSSFNGHIGSSNLDKPPDNLNKGSKKLLLKIWYKGRISRIFRRHLVLMEVRMLNVYASPNEQKREDLWTELKNFVTSVEDPWCIMGDFNSILYDFEKTGGVGVNRRSMNAFADCLECCNLLEVPSKGPFLTWQRGIVQERLDRVLCSQS